MNNIFGASLLNSSKKTLVLISVIESLLKRKGERGIKIVASVGNFFKHFLQFVAAIQSKRFEKSRINDELK